MGRVVGDGALNFEIVDIAVDPVYQGKCYGRLIMQAIMDYLDREAPKGAYISLMADVPELYENLVLRLVDPPVKVCFWLKVDSVYCLFVNIPFAKIPLLSIL